MANKTLDERVLELESTVEELAVGFSNLSVVVAKIIKLMPKRKPSGKK